MKIGNCSTLIFSLLLAALTFRGSQAGSLAGGRGDLNCTMKCFTSYTNDLSSTVGLNLSNFSDVYEFLMTSETAVQTSNETLSQATHLIDQLCNSFGTLNNCLGSCEQQDILKSLDSIALFCSRKQELMEQLPCLEKVRSEGTCDAERNRTREMTKSFVKMPFLAGSNMSSSEESQLTEGLSSICQASDAEIRCLAPQILPKCGSFSIQLLQDMLSKTMTGLESMINGTELGLEALLPKQCQDLFRTDFLKQTLNPVSINAFNQTTSDNGHNPKVNGQSPKVRGQSSNGNKTLEDALAQKSEPDSGSRSGCSGFLLLCALLAAFIARQ